MFQNMDKFKLKGAGLATEGSWVPILVEPLWNFGNPVYYPTLLVDLSDETLKAVGPLYLVSVPTEVKYPTQGVNV